MEITGGIKLTGRGLYDEPYANPADELCDFLNEYYDKKINFETQRENEIVFETNSLAAAEDILEMTMGRDYQPEEVQNYMDEHELEMLRVTFERDEAARYAF